MEYKKFFNYQICILLGLMVFIPVCSAKKEFDINKLSDLKNNIEELSIVICSGGISALLQDKEFLERVQTKISNSPMDNIRENGSKAIQKMLNQGAIKCKENIFSMDQDSRDELLDKITKKKFTDLIDLIDYDESLLTFGGDLDLTDEEEEFEKQVNDLRDLINSSKKKENKYDKKSKGRKERMRSGMDQQQQQQLLDMEEKLKKRVSNHFVSTEFMVFVVSLLAVMMVLFLYFKSKGKKEMSEDDVKEDLKTREIIKQKSQQVLKESDIARRMKIILKTKFGEYGIYQEYERIQEMDAKQLEQYLNPSNDQSGVFEDVTEESED